MTAKRLADRLAELEARLSPPPVALYLFAIHGALSAEDEARRREARAIGQPVVIYRIGVQEPGTVEPAPFAIGPQMAQEMPEPLAAPEAPPEAPTASSASPATPHDPWASERARAHQPERYSAPVFYA